MGHRRRLLLAPDPPYSKALDFLRRLGWGNGLDYNQPLTDHPTQSSQPVCIQHSAWVVHNLTTLYCTTSPTHMPNTPHIYNPHTGTLSPLLSSCYLSCCFLSFSKYAMFIYGALVPFFLVCVSCEYSRPLLPRLHVFLHFP